MKMLYQFLQNTRGLAWLAGATFLALVSLAGAETTVNADSSPAVLTSVDCAPQGTTVTWSNANPKALFAIESSTNLQQWFSEVTYLGTRQWTFPHTNDLRFYRVRSQTEPPSPVPIDPECLYQVSTLPALSTGEFEGTVSSGWLGRLGDIGMGTFEGLNGEMIILNGVLYRINARGQVEQATDNEAIPFAMITRFEPDQSVVLQAVNSFDELKQQLDAVRANVPGQKTEGEICVVRVEANFEYLQTRSVPKQSKPYPTLAEVIEHQSVFEFQGVNATLVGYWFPPSAVNVNNPGWHVHVLLTDHSGGGHLLNCRFASGQASFDITRGYRQF
jgi:acetolactate decarboxylase